MAEKGTGALSDCLKDWPNFYTLQTQNSQTFGLQDPFKSIRTSKIVLKP